jgi:hypothetical protein
MNEDVAVAVSLRTLDRELWWSWPSQKREESRFQSKKRLWHIRIRVCGETRLTGEASESFGRFVEGVPDFLVIVSSEPFGPGCWLREQICCTRAARSACRAVVATMLGSRPSRPL